MIEKTYTCNNCGSPIEVNTYRKFVVCPYCESRFPFKGFSYSTIDWTSSMYASVKSWMDCPACRSPNMYLGPEHKTWRCPDCGYTISNRDKRTGVFWFCDECEVYMNVQPGFTTKNKEWICTACGHINGTTQNDID